VVKVIKLWLPTLTWAAIIFYFSSKSTGVVSAVHLEDFIVKKIVHMAEYAILTTLMYRSLLGSGVKKNQALMIAFVFAILYGLSDEFHQSFTPGREPRLRDTGFDTIGAGIAILSLWKLLPKAPKRLRNLAKRLEVY
jgi:VanZ family protein